LTRRREFIQPSPPHPRYEIRARRSGPTSCSTVFYELSGCVLIGCFGRFGQRCRNEVHTHESDAWRRSGSTSTQQINDLRLELRRVVGPIAVDFPRVPAEGATGRRAPRMDCIMRGSEFVIATDMSDHGDLACRRLCTDHLAFALKGPNDLNAEVNVHRCITMGGMMVDEAIMPVGP